MGYLYFFNNFSTKKIICFTSHDFGVKFALIYIECMKFKKILRGEK